MLGEMQNHISFVRQCIHIVAVNLKIIDFMQTNQKQKN
ncbi:hypothetical protein LEP1GSC170_1195 [Leptospira interrogans serovar Bataviae str. HAI135]|nr:hypothetical protein LEP1GSC170_1195 [Leptospira interrogans serovar Bataviae str. HAI135]